MIAIVGQGKLGTALARALRASGRPVLGPLGRNPDLGAADVALLCVPDREIANAAAAISRDILVAHCSGVSTLDVFGGRESFGLHPLLSVTKETTSFAGAGCAIQATSDRARSICLELAGGLQMIPFDVDPALRPLYHAAASVAANYVVAVEALAGELMRRAGVEPRLLTPLVRSATENWARSGGASLTGPIARGDEATVERQRQAIAEHAPEMLGVWDALAEATRAVARGTLGELSASGAR
jgi:predicted short-subunit dehydrogenase-like oxidoreductase (DUF2520 family)